MDDKYNPYTDETIHTVQPASKEQPHEREGFNDVMKHYDSVNGFQAPKQLKQVPQPVRLLLKLVILLLLTMFVWALLVQLKDIVEFF